MDSETILRTVKSRYNRSRAQAGERQPVELSRQVTLLCEELCEQMDAELLRIRNSVQALRTGNT